MWVSPSPPPKSNSDINSYAFSIAMRQMLPKSGSLGLHWKQPFTSESKLNDIITIFPPGRIYHFIYS